MVAVVSAFCLRFIASVGVSPSGKAPGFGPGISEVRVLPPQPLNRREIGGFLL